ncbi:hypothetical protein C8R44DRAFT_980658 [Mycena epipterygia]|nr:hypothetical protein C8R44DRAFT_980658 [Mycena epipterygia]
MTAKPDDVQRPGKGPVLQLSQVCTEWGAIACDCAILWSSFSCALSHSGSPPNQLGGAVFSPCQGRPVDHRNKWTTRSSPSSTGERILDLLADHSKQLRSLRLFVLHLSKGIIASDQFEIAPRLHPNSPGRLHARKHRDANVPDPPVLYQRLQPREPPHISSVISPTCTLTEIALISSRLLLPRLSSWRIDFGSAISTPANFFSSYMTPVLESLELIRLGQPAMLGEFIQRSKCALKTLVLRESSTSLESFVVEEAPIPTAITDRLFNVLTMSAGCTSPSTACICMFDNAVLLEILESRRAPAAARSGAVFVSLDVVELTLGNRVVKDAQLQQLRAPDGIDVSLDYEYRNGDVVGVI